MKIIISPKSSQTYLSGALSGLCFCLLFLLLPPSNVNAQSVSPCPVSNGEADNDMPGTALDGTESPFIIPPNCLPSDDEEAQNFRGSLSLCDPNFTCDTGPYMPFTPDPPPVFECPSAGVEYSTPNYDPVGSSFVQYWNDCQAGVDTTPDYVFSSQGFINQLFCDTDANGYPAAPSSIGTPLSGVADFPADTESIIDPGGILSQLGGIACNRQQTQTLELIQSDFLSS